MNCSTHPLISRLCKTVPLLLLSILSFKVRAQQEVDRDFVPHIDQPLFDPDKGPVLLIDGGHHNFHTLEDKFEPFGKIAATYGFRVLGNSKRINSEVLNNVNILVIANALNEKNIDHWKQPVLPAFDPSEIEEIRNWVWKGGRLFLIADHMPFAGAVADLAHTMGYTFFDGFALRKPKMKFDVFSFADSTLRHNPITDLHGPLDSIVTFTGQAFKIPDNATSIITLDSNFKILLPETAWEFNEHMKIIPAAGLSQLAYSVYGSGKIVVSGEALMFTAQKVKDFKIGLTAPFARNNQQLLLNILKWLND
jgi:hypothetical protein